MIFQVKLMSELKRRDHFRTKGCICVVAASKMVPVVPTSMAFVPLCNLLPLSGGWMEWLTFNEQSPADVMGCHFWDERMRRPWLSSWAPAPSLSLRLLALGEASCSYWGNPMKRPTWQSLTTTSQVILETDPLPAGPPGEGAALTDSLAATPWETLSQRHPAKLLLDPWTTVMTR